jgi:quinoprotein glucose dehydrogenase
MLLNITIRYLSIVVFLINFSYCKQHRSSSLNYEEWTVYAGQKEGNRYSSLEQINQENVHQLEVAWTYSTGDKDTGSRSQIQCNPIVVDGILYGTSPRLKLFALNAATGEPKWIFDPYAEDIITNNDPYAYYKISRGVTFWKDDKSTDKRIFYSVGSKTFAVDAATGKSIKQFGKGGYFDLTENLDRDLANAFVSGTTPGIIYKDLLIIGTRVGESSDAAPGHIRAYDVRTGKRKWIFHTIPHPGEIGYETWPDKDAWQYLGGANNWAGMSLDEKRGIVYIPTGSIGSDFYGGIRKGTNLFANSLIALEAATGKYLWHYQVIHHDLWDRDLPANPNLVTVKVNGKSLDAVAQITKHGFIFLFNRVTGEPVFPINEIKVPSQALPGEEPWPTQPIPTLPEPFARQHFNVQDISDLTPEKNKELIEKYKSVKYNDMFALPSKEGSWIFPGFDGGGQWGGAAVDIESAIMYVNSSELPWILTMVDVPKNDIADHSLKGIGKSVYNKNCLSCHGPELKGNNSSIPTLVDYHKRSTEELTRKIIENGRNMMPAFKQLTEREKVALISFIMNKEEKEPTSIKISDNSKEHINGEVTEYKRKKNLTYEVPYTMTGYNRFLDNDGYPGIKPPWGTLNAVNLNTGKLLWKVPLGEYDELTEKGLAPTGTENYGGPVVTKGGLIFIAASKDSRIRAFNKNTGKVLWEAKLPEPGYATPSTYKINGKQYVVIACGGGKIGSKSGDQYIAFALPDKFLN